eukprot:TRINITY_DN13840_c0_g1_i5.p1 TRINITY_DN13840_c0_g1~~TRINITY_DN13840_c0_g1_i5.p1  ORF type:complete len:588 (+),score=54.88 TRINITY_DN13840_c0_g1_i5:185-1765(+)
MIEIFVRSVSLQPFTNKQWRMQQEDRIRTVIHHTRRKKEIMFCWLLYFQVPRDFIGYKSKGDFKTQRRWNLGTFLLTFLWAVGSWRPTFYLKKKKIITHCGSHRSRVLGGSRPETDLTLFTFANMDVFTLSHFILFCELIPSLTRSNKPFSLQNRERTVNVHVVDSSGQRVQGASVTIEQISKDFPFGSAIAKTILGNVPYQNYFVKRFNAAVFENELKWYATEPEQGKLNYSLADQLMSFVRGNKITVRGHNIFWEDPIYTPAWVRNLTSAELHKAVGSRIQSLMNRYKEEFIHWDVSNEMLHFDFYESRLGPNATLHFYKVAQHEDPHATLFMNDFNVLETCDDLNSTVDAYISRLEELKRGGAKMEGIGLEGHFSKPNIPLMRAILDKLGTLGFPIWLTEIDISNKFDQHTQAVYLEEVLREGFSHPSVNGIMLWTALHSYGCYEMCLTDYNLNNLPAGTIVDNLLQEWETRVVNGQTDDHGSYIFDGFLGEYNVSVKYGNESVRTTLSLCQSDETKEFYIHL